MTKKGPEMDFLENPVYPKKSAPKWLHFNTYSYFDPTSSLGSRERFRNFRYRGQGIFHDLMNSCTNNIS